VAFGLLILLASLFAMTALRRRQEYGAAERRHYGVTYNPQFIARLAKKSTLLLQQTHTEESIQLVLQHCPAAITVFPTKHSIAQIVNFIKKWQRQDHSLNWAVSTLPIQTR